MAKDITGQKFGKLTAIRFVRSIKSRYIWLFVCECGNEKEIGRKNVISGDTQSCGCFLAQSVAERNYSDITGQKFNRLTAVKFIEKKGTAHYNWLFKCDCGNEKIFRRSSVVSNFTKSCGCLMSEYERRGDITGQKIGKLTAIKFVKKEGTKYLWLFKCDCGNEKQIVKANVVAGSTTSCGCHIRELTSKLNSGKNHRRWNGGRVVKKDGYVSVYQPEHPLAHKKYIAEHRLVMEKIIGRHLLPNENVHHKNGIRHDNRPENLELWAKSQPSGQRAKDLVAHALEILKQYAPEMLSAQAG